MKRIRASKVARGFESIFALVFRTFGKSLKWAKWSLGIRAIMYLYFFILKFGAAQIPQNISTHLAESFYSYILPPTPKYVIIFYYL